MSNTDIFVACSAGLVLFKGKRVRLVPGVTTVRAGHPLLDGREHLFTPLAVTFDNEAEVEEATAAPGRKRRSRPTTARSTDDE
jgi:hypothetical protein